MKKTSQKTYSCSIKIVLSVIMLLVMSHAFAKNNDLQNLMIVGYDGKNWFPYVAAISNGKKIKSNDWRKIKAIRNPAYLTRQPVSGDIYVKGNDGRLYRYQSKDKLLTLLFADDTKSKLNNYTQLRANKKGVVMVKLIKGKSRDTQLVYFDDNASSPTSSSALLRPLLKQASAQFHPLMHNQSLFYAHVSCRTVCNPLIQEVWQQDRVTGKAQQLTLLNATSYLHSVDSGGRFGFISSNQRGYYHVARLDLVSNKVTWLTQGQVTDSFPSVSRDGSVYFIRRTPIGTKLMALGIASEKLKKQPRQVTLPRGVKKIRYLELTH